MSPLELPRLPDATAVSGSCQYVIFDKLLLLKGNILSFYRRRILDTSIDVGKGEIRVGKRILLVTLPTLASEYLQTHQLASSQSRYRWHGWKHSI